MIYKVTTLVCLSFTSHPLYDTKQDAHFSPGSSSSSSNSNNNNDNNNNNDTLYSLLFWGLQVAAAVVALGQCYPAILGANDIGFTVRETVRDLL